MDTDAKVFETKRAIELGSDEIDMVINIGYIKDKKYENVKADIESVVEAAKGRVVKVILETCLLTEEEIIKACKLSLEAGANFVKTSTGFSSGGATIENVKLMKKVVGKKAKVKASGGVRNYETAMQMIKAGADRIGTSSGIAIVKGIEGTGY
jgi:deoxyribose-phosphate aldolase